MISFSQSGYLPITRLFFILLTVFLSLLMPIDRVNTGGITVCADGCDFTTLQKAINSHDVQPGMIIVVRDNVHTEADIHVDKDLTIVGLSAMDTIVQAHSLPEQSNQRVFYIENGSTVTIENMTIRHGNPRSEPESGGGIRNDGTLMLKNVIVEHNSGSAGGGIHNDGSITLINCTVRNNGSRGGGNYYTECKTGGGLKNLAGMMKLINSTVQDNHALAKGGGIHVACNGTLVLVNSTISNNFSGASGGGIFLNGVGEFIHSTISQNEAKTGGGIYIEGSGEKGLIRGQLSYTNTLIAGNIARMEKYGVSDCVVGEYATLAVNIRNWVADGTCDSAYTGDPKLVDLTSMEKSQLTTNAVKLGVHVPQSHSIHPSSEVIDILSPEECLEEDDQWGTLRPQGAGCEIGAYEFPVEGNTAPGTSVALILSVILFVIVVGLSWILSYDPA